MRHLATILLACVVLLSSTAVFAAVRSVPSALYPTIQAAEDASLPGDTIVIAPGTYTEQVVVDVADLRFTGRCTDPRLVVVDSNDTLEGTAFDVSAAGVEFRCMTLRHFTIGIDISDDDLLVDKVRFRHTKTGIEGSSDGFRITNSEFVSCSTSAVTISGDDGLLRSNTALLSDGWQISGDDVVITNNHAEQNEDDDCLCVSGDRMVVKDNFCDGTDDSGMDLSGDDAVVQRNTVLNSDDYGIELDGDRALVEDNVVRATLEDIGIYIDGNDTVLRRNHVSQTGEDEECYELCGNNLVVEDNTATDCGYTGFDIDGDAQTVLRNTVNGAFEYGFAISSDSGVSRVNYNVAHRTGEDVTAFCVDLGDGSEMLFNEVDLSYDYGFDIEFDDGEFRSNRCFRSGADQESCFYLDLDDSEIAGNRAENNGGSGMEVLGNDNVVRSNVLRFNVIDGLRNTGDRNRIELNVTMNNDGEGIQNTGDMAELIRNTSRNNRIDCTDTSGTIVLDTTNCGDGSDFGVPDEVD